MNLSWVMPLALAIGCITAVVGAGTWRLSNVVATRRALHTLPAVRNRQAGVPLKHLVNR